MRVFAIDPGNEQSAWVLYDSARPIAFGKHGNDEALYLAKVYRTGGTHLAIEMIASYGMPVGREVFETCVWIGRFVQAWDAPHALVYRRDVKLHLCGSSRAKDGNVRTALLDRYGGKAAALGTKAAPGPLRGVSSDVWSALAVAVTFSDLRAATGKLGGNALFPESGQS